ncbi:hypothetical protein SDC9_99705 [bioreactor metagenome]|uniref:Uncharacterized protein n=1 Tax=bioreactor metagenome TaxID=1076179 RepID=A0A645AKW2_9ZZZZ
MARGVTYLSIEKLYIKLFFIKCDFIISVINKPVTALRIRVDSRRKPAAAVNSKLKRAGYGALKCN